MILFDSGYFIALANFHDQHFHRAVSWMARVGSERLLVSEHVLVETMNALSSGNVRQPALEIAQAVQRGLQFEFIYSSPALLAEGLARYRGR